MLLSKDRADSRNEKIVIAIWGIETLLVKRGRYTACCTVREKK
jgi:hypothetical protein